MEVFSGSDPNGTWKLFAHDDSGGDSGLIGGGRTLTITTQCPTTITNLTQTHTYTEGAPGVLPNDIVVTDPDVTTVQAQLTLANLAAGSLSTSGGSTYNASTGVWEVQGTVNTVNVALASVAFAPATNNDLDTTILAQIVVMSSGPVEEHFGGTITLDVTPVNDAPTATNLTQAKGYSAGANLANLDDIQVADPDTNEQVTATLTLAIPAAGQFTPARGATHNPSTGVWTINGSVAQVNAALESVEFQPATNNILDTTITTRIRDAAGTGPADGTITLDVTSVGAPVLSNADAQVNEGASGETLVPLTISLSAPSTQVVTVQIASANGTAIGGTDYKIDAGTITFQPGETALIIDLPVFGDTLDEANETFTMTMSSPTNATLGKAVSTITIVDDDAPPVLSVANIQTSEGVGPSSANLTVTLTPASGQAVTVQARTANGTATGGSDFQAAATTVTFGPGETTKSLVVTVIGDTSAEPTESFTVALASPTNATIGQGTATVTIVDDDTAESGGSPPSTVPARVSTLSIADLLVGEGTGGLTPARLSITLDPASSATVTVQVATESGSATSGSDFVPTTATITFNPGETSKTVDVPVIGDTKHEPNESFAVKLSNATGAPIARSVGTVTIRDDDVAVAGSCEPRPAYQTRIRQTGPGTLEGTLTPPAGQVATSVRIQTDASSQVDLPPGMVANPPNGGAGLSGDLTLAPAQVGQPFVIVVKRRAPGAFTTTVTFTDGCGEAKSVVGGGAGLP